MPALDPARVAAARERIEALLAEADYLVEHAKVLRAQADSIARTWRIEMPASVTNRHTNPLDKRPLDP